MKTQIRYKTFETNSSSQHTLTLMMKEDYLKLEKEKDKKRYEPNWFWDAWRQEWVTTDDIVKMANKDSWFMKKYEKGCWETNSSLFDIYVYKYNGGDRFMESEDVVGDIIEKELITPSGDIVVAVSQYIPEM